MSPWTPDHRAAALSKATMIREGITELCAEMTQGDLTLAEAIGDPRAASMRVDRLLRAAPKIGADKSWRLLVAIDCNHIRRVNELTERQRHLLRQLLKGPISGRLVNAQRAGLPHAVDGVDWEARARALDQLIRRHELMVRGPGPAADFGNADSELWDGRQRVLKPRKERNAA